MSTKLTFKDVELTPIQSDNIIFLTCSELSKALGYHREDHVLKIYTRNADEFTAGMTTLIEVETAGGKQKVRAFSLRGAHLIAMFSRTPVAKDFRKWVLDILDKETGQNQNTIETLTPAEQQIIQEAVAEKAKPYGALVGKAKAEIYARLHNKFRVAKYQQLPRTRITEAVIYITNMQLKLKAQTPISSKQYHQLKNAIDRAYGTYIFTESDRQWAMNRIRIQYNIQNINQLPQQHFEEVMDWIQTELTQQTNQLFDLLTQLKEKFNKEVINNNAPWTAQIIKKYKQQTQQQLPQTINWQELANQANLITQ